MIRKHTKQLKNVRIISLGPVYVHSDICVLNNRKTIKCNKSMKNNPNAKSFVNAIVFSLIKKLF